MRALADVTHDIDRTRYRIEDAQVLLEELEDERVRVEDYEAEQRECTACDGTGQVDDSDGVDPEEWCRDCTYCEGTGEVA